MSHSRPFSKLKKQIENLFVPELKMKVWCISYPVRSQYGSSSIPRFYIQLEKEIIWDFPKDFPIKEANYHCWKDQTELSQLIREYIDTPVLELPKKKFALEHIKRTDQYLWENRQDSYDFKLGLTDFFKAADRRLGKEKLLKWSEKISNPNVHLIIAKRFGRINMPQSCKLSFKHRAMISAAILEKQGPVTLEEARAQVLWIIFNSSRYDEQNIKKHLKMYHPDWTDEKIKLTFELLLEYSVLPIRQFKRKAISHLSWFYRK